MKFTINIFLFAWISSIGFAQTFHYTAQLPTIDSTRFYKIAIPPAIISKLKVDESDIRIIDKDNKEIPYIFKIENTTQIQRSFDAFPILKKLFFPDSLTRIIFRNNTGEPINEINLLIRNADVTKSMKLSGSFDNKQWFVVKNLNNITSISNEQSVSEVRLVNFPLTNYIYFMIEIGDKDSKPIDVISIGRYNSTNTNPSYTELKTKFASVDSVERKTWIRITMDEAYIIDKLEFTVSSPQFFNRRANIHFQNPETKNGRHGSYVSINLNSKSENSFPISGTASMEIWVEVFNDDNPPLKIDAIKCLQHNQFLICRLEKENKYSLLFGDSLAVVPQYDLKYFESVIPSSLPLLIPIEMAEVKRSVTATEDKSFLSDTRFIWAILIVVLCFIGVVTYRMLNEIK